MDVMVGDALTSNDIVDQHVRTLDACPVVLQIPDQASRDDRVVEQMQGYRDGSEVVDEVVDSVQLAHEQ